MTRTTVSRLPVDRYRLPTYTREQIMTLLRDLPVAQELARSRAERLYDALYVPGASSPWDFVPSSMREHLVEGQLIVLCTLRDNLDSQDAWARLIGARIRWEGWQIQQAIDDGGEAWVSLCTAVGFDVAPRETTPKHEVLERLALALFENESTEARAKALYNTWQDQPGWTPWVDKGNSDKQDEARRLARAP